MSTSPLLFLLGQQLRSLSETDPDRVRALVCRSEADHDTQRRWQNIERGALIKHAVAAPPGARFGLVCDAGLGKTFNMRWLFDRLCEVKSRPNLPFILRLDHTHDLELLDRAHSDPDVLLDWFTSEVIRCSDAKHAPRVRTELTRKREKGQLILLLDGLDHALSTKHFSTKFAKLLNSVQWRECPVWVAGRPYAFNDVWGNVVDTAPEKWRFFRVERFDEREIRLYMHLCTGSDRYDNFPIGSRGLLDVPRLLKLVCDVVRTAIKRAPDADSAEVVRRLKLNTAADVYHRAYFESGNYDQPDTQGLIAQGIKDKSERIGLARDQEPNEFNFDDRMRRVGILLGVIAFHMFDANSSAEKPEPNTSGMPFKLMKQGVVKRLQEAGQGGVAEFERDAVLLQHMNAHHLDFLLLSESGEKGWRFQDRTAQAFFAAHWAVTFGTDTDRASMRRWIVGETPTERQWLDVHGKVGERLYGFDEFWEFAAEMPDPLIDPAKQPSTNNWHKTFAPCYAPPQCVTGKHVWVQWNRQMIYHSFAAMQNRSPNTVKGWRDSFTRLRLPHEPGHELWREIVDGFRDIPAGICHFGADPTQNQRGVVIWVGAFQLHQCPLTNKMYELFDPAHKAIRWGDLRWGEEHHPLAKKKQGGDDRCPVVNVTWYDAWCFAAWCGYRLPTEQEWDHACRAGTSFRFSFGNDERELPDHAWIDINSDRMTHPVGERPIAGKRHPYGLFDMHGNVCEWCDSWEDSEHEYRLRRGGYYYSNAEECRPVPRDWTSPSDGIKQSIGFRLCRQE